MQGFFKKYLKKLSCEKGLQKYNKYVHSFNIFLEFFKNVVLKSGAKIELIIFKKQTFLSLYLK